MLELDPTYDETTLKLWQQSQEAAVKAGAGIAAELSEMYYAGLMELTVVGTVQLVIFYEAEGEHGKAVLAAAPLAPGVLRKGKELLPKKGTNLADDVVKGVAPGSTATRFRFYFPAGTPVSTPEGKKNIEHIEKGDVVYSWSFEEEKVVERTVQQAFTRHSQQLVKRNLSDGNNVETTGGHPFWVTGKGWTIAEELTVGDQLKGVHGQEVTVSSIEQISGLVTVYNLEVKADHNYFAGDSEILVHNTGGDDFNTAIQSVLEWLKSQGVDVGKPSGTVTAKFGPNKGKPIGLRFEGGGFFRIEYDARTGAHINVGVKKIKGPHIQFEGNQKTVNKVISRFFDC